MARHRDDFLYMVTDGSAFFDGEPKTWAEVLEHADMWALDGMQVFELWTTKDRNGKRRVSIENCREVTDEAIAAAEREANRVPYDTPAMQRELGTVF